jgi:hypothetical protein
MSRNVLGANSYDGMRGHSSVPRGLAHLSAPKVFKPLVDTDDQRTVGKVCPCGYRLRFRAYYDAARRAVSKARSNKQ